jgi:hypothetical protein
MGKENLDLDKVRKMDDKDLKLLIEGYHEIEDNCELICGIDSCKYLSLLKKAGAEPCRKAGIWQLCAEGYWDLIGQEYAKRMRDMLIEDYGKWMADFFAKEEFNRPVSRK